MKMPIEEIDQVFPPLIVGIVRAVAEEYGLESLDFSQRREYDPASSPLCHSIGRGDARVYTGGSDTYLSIANGTLDFYPISTREGKEQIAPNECWIVESGRVEDTDDGYYLSVYQCFDVSLGQGDGLQAVQRDARGGRADEVRNLASTGQEGIILALAGGTLRYGRDVGGSDFICACDQAGQLIERCYWDREELVDLGESAPNLVLGALVRARMLVPDPEPVIVAVTSVMECARPPFQVR